MRADPRPGWRLWAAGLAVALLGLTGPGCAVEPTGSATAPAEPPPPVRARASVDPAVATTGDLITYKVTIDRDAGYHVDLPEPGAEIAGFRIVDVGRDDPVEHDGRVEESRWYQLRADLVGSYVLPPVEVRYWPAAAGEEPAEDQVATVETSAIFVEVESVLASDAAATDIRGLKPLRQPRAVLPWAWIGAGAAALLLALAVGWRLVRRERVSTPPPPPHELAFARLRELRALDLTDPETVRRFYFAISEIVRAYVEGRFGLNATDLTTDEISAQLGGVGDLDANGQQSLIGFLSATDMVKFAAQEPSEREIESTWEDALGFVEATAPAEPDSGEAAA